MYDPVTVIIDEDPIKFTPDGRIDVLDAIASLGAEHDTQGLWRRLILLHPELSKVCGRYVFANQSPALVADAEGWEKIQAALFEFLIETAA
ncbi:MAG: hypothetical protein M0036_19755 [Desulfobacteraceae bacterium]|nr:hypothetical protein [Desulfobacteraceae bacterium]